MDADIFEKQIDVESGFNPKAGSSAGAQGIAQIVPQWHPNVDTWNPWESLIYAASLMRGYLDEYDGDYTLALVRYNGGTGAVIAWLNGEGYDESRRYVELILN